MTEDESPIFGSVAPGFESVRDVFRENISAGQELAASIAVSHGGRQVVDLWGGYSDVARRTPLPADALFTVFSTTKGLAASCICLLVDKCGVKYEDPVSRYWSEFAAGGKGAVTVGELLSHQAGVCGPREPVTIQDYYSHERVAKLLAAQTPFFKPGSAWGYHALSIGTLADELVRRVAGCTIREFFRKQLAEPLKIDVYLGLPESEDHRHVQMLPPEGASNPSWQSPNRAAYLAAFENPPLDPYWPNSRDWRAIGLAGAGGTATARGLARLYDALANGGEVDEARLIRRRKIEEARRERISGIDQTTGSYDRYAAGFRLNVGGYMGPNPDSFGHPGWGGSCAFADPQQRCGIAYVMSKMLIGDWGSADPRHTKLIREIYRAFSRTIS